MSYDVLTYGSAALRRKSKPVAEVGDDMRRLAKEMLSTMYESDGVGLAAQQIGRAEAICVIDVPARSLPPEEFERHPQMPLIMVNPEIESFEGTQIGREGCLSFPGVCVNIKRAMSITVSFLDGDGTKRTIQAVGLLSRAIQHEVDHLNGVLLVDRMSWSEKLSVAGQLKRLKKDAEVSRLT